MAILILTGRKRKRVVDGRNIKNRIFLAGDIHRNISAGIDFGNCQLCSVGLRDYVTNRDRKCMTCQTGKRDQTDRRCQQKLLYAARKKSCP